MPGEAIVYVIVLIMASRAADCSTAERRDFPSCLLVVVVGCAESQGCAGKAAAAIGTTMWIMAPHIIRDQQVDQLVGGWKGLISLANLVPILVYRLFE